MNAYKKEVPVRMTIDDIEKENNPGDSHSTDSSMDRNETTELQVERMAGIIYEAFIYHEAETCCCCLR